MYCAGGVGCLTETNSDELNKCQLFQMCAQSCDIYTIISHIIAILIQIQLTIFRLPSSHPCPPSLSHGLMIIIVSHGEQCKITLFDGSACLTATHMQRTFIIYYYVLVSAKSGTSGLTRVRIAIENRHTESELFKSFNCAEN